MLEEFTVDNFKSLINVTFRPHEQNLLLGVNNAGKTNLCQAIKFLACTAPMPVSDCADEVGVGVHAIANHYFDKATIDFGVTASVPFTDDRLTETPLSYDYRLSIVLRQADTASATLKVQRESLEVNGGGFDDVLLLENTDGDARLLDEDDYVVKGRTNYVQTTAPRDATMLNRLYDLESNPRANCFKWYLMSWQYYALSAAALRGFEHRPAYGTLLHDGRNLASVVYQLKTENEREYRSLVKHLQTIDPSIDLINFRVPSEDKVFMFFEDKKGKGIPASIASSGTLRFLALLYILVTQPRQGRTSLRIIEEPENGIYVGCLKHLLESAGGVAPPQQLIFTSHSPYFVDLFDDKLDSIFLMKRGDRHSSITKPDPELIKKRLEKFPLGEQHFREMLR